MRLRRAELGDGIDFRKVRVVAKDGMADSRLPHLAGEGDMPRMIQVLAAEKDDLPFQERIVDRFPDGGRERL